MENKDVELMDTDVTEPETVDEPVDEPVDVTGMFESDTIDMTNIPKPESMEDEPVHKKADINQVKSVDDMLDMIMEPDPEDKNHSNTYTIAMIQKLHGITEDTQSIDDIPEENREYVDDIEVADCRIDMSSLDGNHVIVTLTFDSIHSAYLKELNEILNRYRIIQEDLSVNGTDDTAAMFSLIFMPRKMEGLASCQLNFPIMYSRVLAENDVNCAMQLLFNMSDMKFALLDIDDDTDAEITADAMREAESGTGGYIFDV